MKIKIAFTLLKKVLSSFNSSKVLSIDSKHTIIILKNLLISKYIKLKILLKNNIVFSNKYLNILLNGHFRKCVGADYTI